MPTTFRLEHFFSKIPLDKFEKYLNHPTLNHHLSQIPAFRSRELLKEQRMPSGDVEWVFKVQIGLELPMQMRNWISMDMLCFHETSRFVANDHCIYWKAEPVVGKSKLQSEGRFLLTKKGKGTLRVVDGTIAILVPLVGQLVERFFIRELEKNYTHEIEVQNRFYAEMS